MEEEELVKVPENSRRKTSRKMAWKPRKSFNHLMFMVTKTYYVPDTMLQTNTDEASVVSP